MGNGKGPGGVGGKEVGGRVLETPCMFEREEETRECVKGGQTRQRKERQEQGDARGRDESEG